MDFAIKFESSKFVFNPVCVDDASALLTSVNSKAFPSSLPLAEIRTLTQAKAWCLGMVSSFEAGDCYVWTCRRTSDLVIVGQVTLLPNEKGLALAYWVEPSIWGRGVATQMCKSLLTHIQKMGYRGNVWAGVHSWNIRSSSVLEKLDFKKIDSDDKNVEYLLEIN